MQPLARYRASLTQTPAGGFAGLVGFALTVRLRQSAYADHEPIRCPARARTGGPRQRDLIVTRRQLPGVEIDGHVAIGRNGTGVNLADYRVGGRVQVSDPG